MTRFASEIGILIGSRIRIFIIKTYFQIKKTITFVIIKYNSDPKKFIIYTITIIFASIILCIVNNIYINKKNQRQLIKYYINQNQINEINENFDLDEIKNKFLSKTNSILIANNAMKIIKKFTQEKQYEKALDIANFALQSKSIPIRSKDAILLSKMALLMMINNIQKDIICPKNNSEIFELLIQESCAEISLQKESFVSYAQKIEHLLGSSEKLGTNMKKRFVEIAYIYSKTL